MKVSKTLSTSLLILCSFLSLIWIVQQFMPESFDSPVARVISLGALVFGWLIYLTRNNLSETTVAVSALICGAAFGLQGALNFGSPVYIAVIVLALIPVTAHLIERTYQLLLFVLYLSLLGLVADGVGFQPMQIAVHVIGLGFLTFGATYFLCNRDQNQSAIKDRLGRVNRLAEKAVDLAGIEVYEVDVDSLSGAQLKGDQLIPLTSQSMQALLGTFVLNDDQLQALIGAIGKDALEQINKQSGASYIAELEYYPDENRQHTRWNRVMLGDIYKRGEHRYRLVLRRDITTGKQRERKLHELNLNLDQLRRSQHIALDITQSAVMEINVKTGIGRIIEGSKLLLPLGEPISALEMVEMIVDPRDQPKIRSLLEQRNQAEIARINEPSTGQLRYWVRFTIGDEFERDGERFVLLVRQVISDEIELTQKIESQNKQFQLAGRVAKVAIFRHDLRDDSVMLSDSGYELLGFTRSAVPNLDFERFVRFIPAGDKEQVRSLIEAAISTGASQSITHAVTNARGEKLHIDVRFAAEFEDGEPIAILGAMTDVTSLVESEAQARALIAQLEQTRIDLETAIVGGRIGLFTRESYHETMNVNDVFREITGLSETDYPEITRSLFRSFIHPDDLAKQESAFAHLTDGQSFQRYELRVIFPTRGMRNLLFSLSLDAHVSGHPTYRGSIVDMTEVRSTEARLRSEINKQEQLFAIIGHELRTPASALKMLLEDQHVIDLEPHGKTISDTIEHLMTVLDDMRIVTNPELALDSKAVAGSVPDMVRRTLPLVQRLLQEKRIRVNFEADSIANVECLVHEQLLRQITLNLVKNCALHSKADQLNIHVLAEEQGPFVHFTLRFEDNGKGIPEAEAERLFDPFERGESDEDGTGLGLHISRTYARNILEGDLNFETGETGGATFVLTARFPKTSSEAHQLEPTPVEPLLDETVLEGRRVLYAEDSPVLRMMTAKALEKKGALLAIAEDGEEAIQLAEQAEFDMVLTDIFMPNKDGYELTLHLRKSGFKGPIIGLTAAVVGEESDRLLNCGADEVLPKPLNMKALLSAVALRKDLLDGTRRAHEGQPRVLIIDDDPISLGRLESILEDHYDVMTQNSGMAAIECFADFKPDLVLCDIQMPQLDGFAVFKRLKAISPTTPFVMISGADSADHYFRIADAMGAKATLDKQTKPERLLRTVSEVLAG